MSAARKFARGAREALQVEQRNLNSQKATTKRVAEVLRLGRSVADLWLSGHARRASAHASNGLDRVMDPVFALLAVAQREQPANHAGTALVLVL